MRGLGFVQWRICFTIIPEPMMPMKSRCLWESLQENTTAAVAGQLLKTPSVRRFKNIQVIVATVKDMTGSLQLTSV